MRRRSLLSRTATILLTTGLLALVASFGALIRDRPAPGVLLVIGVVLLAVGAATYFLSSRTPREAGHDVDANAQRDTGGYPTQALGNTGVANILSYIALGAGVVLLTWLTAMIAVRGADGSILALLWIGLIGFAAFVLTRRFTSRP